MSLLTIISGFANDTPAAIVVDDPAYSIIVEGDSLSALPANGGASPAWSELLRDDLSLTTYPYIQNFAVAGQSVRNAINTTAQVYELVRARKFDCDLQILSLLMGINDIQAEVSGGQGLYDDMAAYVLQFTVYDFSPIVFCLTYSRATVFDEAKHLRMKDETDIYNDLLRAGWSTDLKAKVLIDLQTYPLFGGYVTPTTSPYFLADHLHYSTEGKTALKDIIKEALDLIIAGGTGVIEYP